MTIALALSALLLAACASGNSGPGLEQQGGPGEASPPAFDIPVPSEVAKSVQSTTQDRLRYGQHYIPGMAQNLGGDSQAIAQYLPSYDGEESFDVAYGIYAFTLNDYTEGNSINLNFWDQQLAAPPAGTVFVGLSDFASNSWRWYAADESGHAVTGNIGSMLNDLNELYVAVVAIGEDPFDLAGVMVGDGNPPVAIPQASSSLFLSDTLIDFNGSASLSYNHAITQYEWDFDDDGVFEETGEVVNGKLFAPGMHKVTLRIADQADLFGTGSIWIQSVNADNIPDYIEVEDNDSLEQAQLLPTGPWSDFLGNLGTGGVLDGDKHDWYRIHMPAHGGMSVRIFYDYGEVDFSLQVTNDQGVVLDDQNTHGPEEFSLLMSLAAGDYYIHVYQDNEDTSGNYGMQVQTEYGEAPVALMSGSSASIAQGESLTLNASQSYDLDGEIDQYRWDLYGDGQFERITNTDSVTMYGSVMRVGTFTAKVVVVDDDGFAGQAEFTYTVSGDQQYDEMEDNDNAGEAMFLSWFPESNFATFVGDIGEGGGYDGDDEDWISFELTEAGDVQFICNPLDQDHGGITLSLYGPGGHIVTDESENPVKGIQNPVTLDPGLYKVLVRSDWGSTRWDMSGHFIPEM
jgi:hypothetical protein